jgi:hypothetical protein
MRCEDGKLRRKSPGNFLLRTTSTMRSSLFAGTVIVKNPEVGG